MKIINKHNNRIPQFKVYLQIASNKKRVLKTKYQMVLLNKLMKKNLMIKLIQALTIFYQAMKIMNNILIGQMICYRKHWTKTFNNNNNCKIKIKNKYKKIKRN